jgi:hypothetical protein
VPKAPQARSCEQRPQTKEQVPESRPDGARDGADGACEVAQRPGAPREHSISTPAPTSAADTPAVLGGETGTGAVPPKAVMLTPNVLSTKHWSRLLGGALYAASPRVDWATLLRRSFDVDVLRCAGCGGRLRVLGEVTEPSLVRLVLESLGLPPDAPPVARARDPTDLLGAGVD